MATIEFIGFGAIDVEPGTTVMAAARRMGLKVESPCNGAGTCGKCLMQLHGNAAANVRRAPNSRLTAAQVDAGWVLACETEVNGNLTVSLPNGHDNRSLQILGGGHSFDVVLQPNITKHFDPNQDATVVSAGPDILGTETGDTTAGIFGLAFDIGTTTLVLTLVDLNDGRELDRLSALNPQALFAQDVLSRIKYAENGLEEIHRVLVEELNRMIGELATRQNIETRQIYEIVFSGNTCMLHLATGTSPAGLGKYPYISALKTPGTLEAADLGLAMAPFGLVYLPPVISAYVGADITAGLLACQLGQRPEATLFVDIGTNGEMALACEGKLTATSTAAGPAFEGMNITCGMRAADGAIQGFKITESGLELDVIGKSRPVGICGSGLFDTVAELVAHGVIGKNGRFTKNGPLSQYLTDYEGKPAFAAAAGVVLTQKDIRQVQLAKGAVRAGIEMLLQAVGCEARSIERVLIAGSFGYHLRPESLLGIGILPPEFAGKIEFVGNTSATGARALLLNTAYREQMSAEVGRVAVLELADLPEFEKEFVRCLTF